MNGHEAVVKRFGAAVLLLVGLVALAGCVADPPPLIGTAVAGDARAVVSWEAPLAVPAPISAYIVTPWIGQVAQSSTQFNSTATTETVTGLTNGTTYTFTVKAINTLGNESASSGSSNPVTPEIRLPTSFVVHYTGPTDDGSYGTNGDFTLTGAVGVNGCSVSNGCFLDLTGVTGTWHSDSVCPGGGDLSADSTALTGEAGIGQDPTSATGFAGSLDFTVWSTPFGCPSGAHNSQQFYASTGGPPYQPWQSGATHTDWTSIGGGTFSIDWAY